MVLLGYPHDLGNFRWMVTFFFVSPWRWKLPMDGFNMRIQLSKEVTWWFRRSFFQNLCLVGGFNQPLWKMMELVSWGDDIPNIWRNKTHVPNHQPVILQKSVSSISLPLVYTPAINQWRFLWEIPAHRTLELCWEIFHRTTAGGFSSHGADCRRRPWMRIEPTINGNFRILNIGLIYGRYLQFRILEWPLKPKLRFKWSWYLVGGFNMF